MNSSALSRIASASECLPRSLYECEGRRKEGGRREEGGGGRREEGKGEKGGKRRGGEGEKEGRGRGVGHRRCPDSSEAAGGMEVSERSEREAPQARALTLGGS